MTPDRELCRGVIRLSSPEQLRMHEEPKLLGTLLRMDSNEERRSVQRYLWVAFGGALGSVVRFWVGSTVASRMGTRFPYGTFIINITACLIIGFSLEYLGRHIELTPAWRYLIPVGFVGAYSTFSTFEWEILSNLQLGAFLIAGLYLCLSVILGLVAAWCGLTLAKMIP